MALSENQIQQRIDGLGRKCKERGLRLTRQRLEIFREIARTEAHPDAETVCSRVRERMPRLSLDTVYRTLTGLEELGLLQKLSVAGGTATRFDANPQRHYHFICSRCGMIRDFASEHLDNFTPPPALEQWGCPEQLQAEVRGTCNECLKKRRKKQA